MFVRSVKTSHRLFSLINYFIATSLEEIPISELIIFALAIAIERLFFAPLSKNATPSLTLLVGFANFFNINYFPLDSLVFIYILVIGIFFIFFRVLFKFFT